MGKRFSKWSLILAVSGLLLGLSAVLINLDWINNFALLIVGFFIYLAAIILLFTAFIKKEESKLKYLTVLSLIPFFIGVLFILTFLGGV